MKKTKTIFKFLIITFVILLVTVGIPSYYFNKYLYTQYLETVEGTCFIGPAGYFVNIITNPNATTAIKCNVEGLMNQCKTILVGKSVDLLNLNLCTSALLGIAIIFIGIVLYRYKKKLVSYAFMSAGVISIISYMLMYVTALKVMN